MVNPAIRQTDVPEALTDILRSIFGGRRQRGKNARRNGKRIISNLGPSSPKLHHRAPSPHRRPENVTYLKYRFIINKMQELNPFSGFPKMTPVSVGGLFAKFDDLLIG